MAKYLMFQGTASHVGKSILTAAMCRIFFRAGLRVTPFKAQNMALNSFVTADGGEMGRAQVAQAEAAGLLPIVEMNPVLLKPTGNSSSQVIINGKPVGVMSAAEYHKSFALTAFDAVKSALAKLSAEFELIVIEGAGSPAEVNLKSHDIVNMRVAKYLNAPVILVADIDRGGALASIVGTLELLSIYFCLPLNFSKTARVKKFWEFCRTLKKSASMTKTPCHWMKKFLRAAKLILL